ncbi:MAG: metal-dependent hydrolase [Methanomicrobiales archaeon]|nr:metal-dependent hydrolase [Methanomicrobiales archaeon]
MKGVHHLSLSILSLIILTLPFYPVFSPTVWVAVFAGVFAGSLAPDVDAPDASIFHLTRIPRPLRILLALFGYLLRYLVYFPLSFLFFAGLGQNYRHQHRGLLHTPAGVTLATLLLVFYAGLLAAVLSIPVTNLILASGGAFWAGCILHIVQDSCTPAGIAWRFPRSNRRVRGSIRTDSRRDIRPVLYVSILAGCLAVLYFIPAHFPLHPSIAAPLMLAGAWVLFLLLARPASVSS